MDAYFDVELRDKKEKKINAFQKELGCPNGKNENQPPNEVYIQV